jgi:hypothetical protein
VERRFSADRIQVGVVLCGLAELLRHLNGVPEVIERGEVVAAAGGLTATPSWAVSASS